ncbi:MAG: hypothetical protein LBF75_02010 [Treponema sp.]|jgi:hypothetical protein|nr:hypothetical protein [Treponema sp.]
MVCDETDDIRDFDGIIKSYELMLNYKKWRNAGILTIPNVNRIGDINKTDGLNRAKEIGINL